MTFRFSTENWSGSAARRPTETLREARHLDAFCVFLSWAFDGILWHSFTYLLFIFSLSFRYFSFHVLCSMACLYHLRASVAMWGCWAAFRPTEPIEPRRLEVLIHQLSGELLCALVVKEDCTVELLKSLRRSKSLEQKL